MKGEHMKRDLEQIKELKDQLKTAVTQAEREVIQHQIEFWQEMDAMLPEKKQR
jgi:hypothetical protein